MRCYILYYSEVFRKLSFGQYTKRYIRNIRYDGRYRLSLQLVYKNLDNNAALIEEYLIAHDGSIK